MNVAISNSTFDSCTAPHNMGYGAIVAGQASSVMSDNHFNGHNIPAPTVRFVFSPNTTLHQCTFERTGWAMSADTDWYNPDSVWHISAEDNWWGDPSGPRHSILNPTGLGDSIVGPVNFSPWLTEDPLSSPKPRGLFPSGFVLESYPEPFNLEVRLKLTVADPGRYKLELFDLLGRRVREIWEGSVVFDREVSFSTDNLASGVYFACATESSSRLPVVTTKLVLLK